ncbi:hypothetical protein, partial [uncultured Zoogloea sp.]|uniref:hypothetical protein n=1 Tax=uncultured Zoogloea sp. TaxID=160237 RepID=UPI00260B3ECA
MTAYDDALDTDARWMTEIKRAFPRERAGDVRYTERAHGEPGTALRRAYDAYVAARDALMDVLERALPPLY